MENQKMSIVKKKKIIRIVAIITLTLEVIFFTVEELIDLHNSLSEGQYKELYNRKLKLSLFRMIGNGVFYLFILIILILGYYNALLLGGIMYLVLGLIAFLYLIIEMNTSASQEARPKEYYDNNIGLYLNLFYILAGIMLLTAAGLILFFVKQLYNEKKIKEEEEKNNIIKQEEGKTSPLMEDAEMKN